MISHQADVSLDYIKSSIQSLPVLLEQSRQIIEDY